MHHLMIRRMKMNEYRVARHNCSSFCYLNYILCHTIVGDPIRI